MDDADAEEAFFDFRVADIAMGSGHFLVAAVDRIESRLYSYLSERPLPGIEEELDRLQDKAEAAFEDEQDRPEIERGQLLRRQIARRCIYGVDLNPLATELARLSIWVHTFVPGLPLTFLDYNLVTGDSLVGVGTMSDVEDLIDTEQSSLEAFLPEGQKALQHVREDLDRLGQMADGDAEQIREAQETRKEIESELSDAAMAFDIMAASRLDDDIDLDIVKSSIGDLATSPAYQKATEALEGMKPFHFPVAFPEVFQGSDPGFDVVVGNPPWDKVLHEEQQFWVSRFPGLNTLPNTRRRERIEELREGYPSLAKEEDREQTQRERYQDYFGSKYKLQGRGHKDFSKLFVERALSLCNEGGLLSYVLPRQSMVLGGWKRLREAMFDGREVRILQARNKGGWIFEGVHHSYMVALVSQCAEAPAPEVHLWPVAHSEAEMRGLEVGDALRLSEDDLLTITDTYVVPWLETRKSIDLFDRMIARPRLKGNGGWIDGEHDTRWDFRNSGRHGDLYTSEPSDREWRVMMTRHVRQFSLDEGRECRRYAVPEDLIDLDLGLVEADGGIELGQDHPIIVFRHPSRNDDTRTLIATAMPSTGWLFCAGYAHAISCPQRVGMTQQLGLLGYANTFLADWWVRRIVDRHVTKPVINNLPLPEWDEAQQEEAAEITEELLVRNGLEGLPGGETLQSHNDLAEAGQDELRVRLEALAAEGYDVNGTEMEVVLSDFSENACPEGMKKMVLDRVSST